MSSGWLYRPSHLASGTLHSFGSVTGSDAQARLDALMEHEATFLLDIRSRPLSRFRPSWNRAALSERYGPRYGWVPSLGNQNYQHKECGIQLAEGHGQAVRDAAQLVASGLSLVFLCACKDERRCHRTLVIEKIKACLSHEDNWWLVFRGDGDETGILDWTRGMIRAADGLGLDAGVVVQEVRRLLRADCSTSQADDRNRAKGVQ
jgi:hypothetical protein